MVAIDYSDSTPDVSFTFNRLGQQATIMDGQGTRVFSYNDKLQLAAETNLACLLTRNYDSLGRSSGFTLNSDYAVGYKYRGDGRFFAVTSTVAGVQQRFEYQYLPNSDLISGMSNDVVRTSRTYEPNRNLLTSIVNTAGANPISRFDYGNDELARRTRRVDNAAVTNNFGYNLRSELTSAAMGTNNYGYQYDPIGNRLTATNNASVFEGSALRIKNKR